MQPFPHPSDATHKIWSRLAKWLLRYSSLKVWTTDDDGRRRTTTDDDGRRRTPTDDDGRRRTDDGPLLYYKLTLWAFGSGELKMCYFLNIFRTNGWILIKKNCALIYTRSILHLMHFIFGQFLTELWPLIDVRILFPFNILRTNWWILMKFCECSIVTNTWNFPKLFNRVMALDPC